eukprot:1459921-Rhodomonas_salina.1
MLTEGWVLRRTQFLSWLTTFTCSEPSKQVQNQSHTLLARNVGRMRALVFDFGASTTRCEVPKYRELLFVQHFRYGSGTDVAWAATRQGAITYASFHYHRSQAQASRRNEPYYPEVPRRGKVQDRHNAGTSIPRNQRYEIAFSGQSMPEMHLFAPVFAEFVIAVMPTRMSDEMTAADFYGPEVTNSALGEHVFAKIRDDSAPADNRMIETGIGVVLRQCMVVPVVQPMEHRHAFTFVPDQAEAMVEASMEPKVAAIRYPVHVGYALTSLGCPVLTWYQTTCDIRYWRTLRCYQAHVFAVRLGRLVLTWGMRLPGVGKGAALPVCRGTRVPP